jgi:2-amino-4-hydroxy-6-hydroxymethyldihydropteridine diphosphokinase
MPDTSSVDAAVAGLPPTYDAILALGSNIGNRIENIDEAIRRLGSGGVVEVIARSRLYRTAPWGVLDQDWFVNACVAVRTKLSPHALLKHCQGVENDMGRVRARHWGPRVIDVDILVFRDRQIRDPDLVVPHPLIAERGFVLVPLRDVAPDLMLGGKSVDALLAAIDTKDVVPMVP